MSDPRLEKAYRTYPILRYVSPAMQAEVLRNAQTRVKRKSIVGTIGRLLLLMVLLSFVLVVMMAAWVVFVRSATHATSSGVVQVVGVLLFLVCLVVVGAAVWMVENAVSRSATRAELRRTLLRRECYQCGYVLAGLIPVDGMVRCPECSNINASLIADDSEIKSLQ